MKIIQCLNNTYTYAAIKKPLMNEHQGLWTFKKTTIAN
jgi:hypothetical protein